MMAVWIYLPQKCNPTRIKEKNYFKVLAVIKKKFSPENTLMNINTLEILYNKI